MDKSSIDVKSRPPNPMRHACLEKLGTPIQSHSRPQKPRFFRSAVPKYAQSVWGSILVTVDSH